MAIPLAMTIWYSFSRYNLLNPDVKGFAGFDNYHFLATDPAFGPSIGHTLTLIGSVLLITVVRRRAARGAVRPQVHRAGHRARCWSSRRSS